MSRQVGKSQIRKRADFITEKKYGFFGLQEKKQNGQTNSPAHKRLVKHPRSVAS